MRKIGVLALLTLFTLTGCQAGTGEPTNSASPTVEPTVTETATATPVEYTVPISCDLPSMLGVIEDLGFTGSEDVTPPWDPADGTDLKIALDNGGLACAWGPYGTDVGVVVYWVKLTGTAWEDAKQIWLSEGEEQVDIPGLDEDEAYFVYSPAGGDYEWARWEANARFGDLWVQVGTSSFVEPDSANTVFEEALKVASGN